MKKREIWTFLVVAFALGFAAQVLAIRGGVGGGGRGWLWLAMWAPAVAAMTSRGARAAAFAALRRGGGRWLGAALLVGWGLTLAQQALLFAFGGGRWNADNFPPAPGGVEAVRHVAMVLGVGPQGAGFFALNLALSLALGSAVGGLVGGLGEELGWRAVLQPEFERRWGPLRGTLATGLVWAYWHLPANLGGLNDAVHPLWTTFVFFPAGAVAMAFSFAWLTRRTGSVWPAALAHGANNCIAAGFLLVPRSWSWDTATALLAAAVVGGLFAALSARRATPSPSSSAGDAELART